MGQRQGVISWEQREGEEPSVQRTGCHAEPPTPPFSIKYLSWSLGYFQEGQSVLNGMAKRWRKRWLCREVPSKVEGVRALAAGLGSAILLAAVIRHPLFLVPANTAKQQRF